MLERYQRILYSLAFLFAALSLGPALAHLLELPNKIGLPRDAYFTVQAIYRGWAFLGVVIFGALLSTLALSIALRRERRPMIFAAAALICIVLAQTAFWTYTYPVNVATQNWTQIPPNWEELRRQWEYSHAVGATLTLASMMALVTSVLTWASSRRRV
jgi:hypothetical protein